MRIKIPVSNEFTYAMGDAIGILLTEGKGKSRFVGSESDRDEQGEIVQYYAVYEISGATIVKDDDVRT